MPFAKPLPEWNAAGIEPPQSLKDGGWKAGMKPPDAYFNWYMYSTYQALLEIQQKAALKDEIPLPPEASTTQKGVTKLNDTTNSTSTTEAATANAVRKVNDALVTHSEDTTKHITAAERTTWNAKETTDGAKTKADAAETRAKAYTDTAPEAMLRKTGRFRKTNSQKDPNIRTYLVREYRRKDGTLFARSVLSDPNAEGKPTVRTETFYEADGVTEIVADRMVFDIVYDADGDYKEEIPR